MKPEWYYLPVKIGLAVLWLAIIWLYAHLSVVASFEK